MNSVLLLWNKDLILKDRFIHSVFHRDVLELPICLSLSNKYFSQDMPPVFCSCILPSHSCIHPAALLPKSCHVVWLRHSDSKVILFQLFVSWYSNIAKNMSTFKFFPKFTEVASLLYTMTIERFLTHSPKILSMMSYWCKLKWLIYHFWGRLVRLTWNLNSSTNLSFV